MGGETRPILLVEGGIVVDHSTMKLGKKHVKHDRRTMRLGNLLTDTLPPLPSKVDYSCGNKLWGMLANDKYGDCTIAGVAHAVQVWEAATKDTIPQYDDETILSYYSKWDGYVKGDPNTDNGGIELDVLNSWRHEQFEGHELLAYCALNTANEIHVKQGINLFGVVYIGVELPITAQRQEVWSITSDPGDGTADVGSWGGHCVIVLGYDDADKTYLFLSWGRLMKMTYDFWKRYTSEAYPLMSKDWIQSGIAPSGLDQAKLNNALQAIG